MKNTKNVHGRKKNQKKNIFKVENNKVNNFIPRIEEFFRNVTNNI